MAADEPGRGRRMKATPIRGQHQGLDDAGKATGMFLTATEVGRELGVGKSRVYELAAGGVLPTVRLGRRIYFPRRGLEELAEAAIERVMSTDSTPAERGHGR